MITITARMRALGAAGALLLTAPAAHASPSGPCTEKVAAAAPSLPGAYVPQCASNGFFKPLQSHASTGYSWCVNPKTGAEVPETRKPSGAAPADCGQCAAAVAAGPSANAVGAYIPQCASNGSFKPLQSHASTGYSWCVNPKTGAEVPGTRRPPGAAPPVCG